MEDSCLQEELKTVRVIERFIFSKVNFGIDWTELDCLADANICKEKIDAIGTEIARQNPEVFAKLLNIADTLYCRSHPAGTAPDFFTAVNRMGTDRVKTFIFALTLFSLAKGPEARMRAAKSASISALGKMIAEAMNLRDELVRKVETGGLLSQLGKSVFLKTRKLGMNVSDYIVQKYESHLAVSIIEHLNLDSSLKKTVDLSIIEFDEKGFSPVGIIKMAEALTEDSFRRYGKLVLRSPMSDVHDASTTAPGDAIAKLFAALGVSEYLEISGNSAARHG